MARWAIGDVQGCGDELEELLARPLLCPTAISCGSSAIWSIAARGRSQALRLVRTPR